MKKIIKFVVVTRSDQFAFVSELEAFIAKYQNEELEVEVQFSTSESRCSALVIGRK